MCSGSWKKSPQTPKGPTSEVCRLRFPQLKSAGEREREREGDLDEIVETG